MIERKKVIAVFGAVLITITLLTGCFNKKEAKESMVRQIGELTSVLPSEINGISWMVHSGMKQNDGTDLWVDEFEKKTGVHLTLNLVPNNEYDTVLELAMLSNAAPDVFDLDGKQQLATYVKRGLVADLTNLVEKADFYEKVDKSLWESIAINDKIYGVPYEIASGAVTYIRKDWLDRVGLAAPKNYEDFINVLRAFRDQIEECIVPLTAPSLRYSQYLPEFYQGASAEFVKVNGKWVDGFTQDNMAETLHRMQDAYQEGLIDPQIVTNTTSNCRDQWYMGSVGVFAYWAGNWGQILTERLRVNVPEADVLAMQPIEQAVYLYSLSNVFSISANVSQEKLEFIFDNFIEYMHDGKEGQVLFQSGVEGVHWEQDGDYIKSLPSISNPDEMFRKAWITPWMAISPLEVKDKNVKVDKAVTDSLSILETYGVASIAYPVSETLDKISDDLNQLKETYLAKIVMGDLSVKEGMEGYKRESLELGVDQVLKEMNGD